MSLVENDCGLELIDLHSQSRVAMSHTSEQAMAEDDSILPIALDYELMPREKRIAKVRGIVDDILSKREADLQFEHQTDHAIVTLDTHTRIWRGVLM